MPHISRKKRPMGRFFYAKNRKLLHICKNCCIFAHFLVECRNAREKCANLHFLCANEGVVSKYGIIGGVTGSELPDTFLGIAHHQPYFGCIAFR